MIIKVLGTGCPKCKLLEQTVRDFIAQENIEAEVVKVQSMEDIMSYDIMSLPWIVVDEKLVMSGKIPSREELKNIL